MIAVQVRDEHRIDPRRRRGRVGVPPQVGHPRAQDRVGEETSRPDLDEKRGVADVRDVAAGYGRRSFRQLGGRRITPAG